MESAPCAAAPPTNASSGATGAVSTAKRPAAASPTRLSRSPTRSRAPQHAHNLIIYKATQPSAPAQVNLSSLGILYIAYHWECLTGALGGPLTHIVTVPSTRGRQGPHPIETIITNRIRLPRLQPLVNTNYSPDDRDFHADRFWLPPGAATGARVLLMDDTWTSGGRIQSLAYMLKATGAAGVAAVVLGRHVNPEYGPARTLIRQLRAAPRFDLTRCALEDSGRTGT